MMASESSTKPIKEISTPAQSKKPTPKLKFKGHEERIWDFVFLHDNIHIVSSSEDGIMRKWNCKTGFAVGKPWKGEGGDIYALSLSPNGKMIACGRVDGSVQRWSTNGEMIKGVWTGHSKAVRSLSWSPSGSHIASGSDDGTILIRNAESGKVKVGPIKTEQEGVESLAYSPSGDRLASGGFNTICIWNAKTGEPVVTPTKDLGNTVTSLVWSSDSSKLYSAAGSTAHVFDSKSGEQFYHFNMKHSSFLWSIALSPKQNVLACVGNNGVAQLWDIESYQPLGQPLCEDDEFTFRCVSFSQDGRYVACGGDDKKLTLWMVQDIIPQLPAPTLLQRSDRQSTQQETRPNSPLSSCLDADATGGGGFIEEAYDDPYNNFFQSSRQSLPSPSPPLSPGFHFPSLFLARRFLNVISRHRPPPDEFIPKESSKRSFFSRRARSNSSLELATMTPNQPVPGTKVKQSQGEQGDDVDDVSAVSTIAHCHFNLTAASVVPHMIRSAPDMIKANSEMILPTMHRTHHLIIIIALSLPTCIAKIVEASGND
ncbi:WD40-repeat-containing domain protein [Suillus subaureus]|uniref:WD40-repeat-containing domain protein n=1 Tax=Suillus subaureus TaxID=48587 RepID=A0A9P7EEC8_9AGAM|nr:WD40-repeat-containing domain protein [Suillus subaureus]KAG1818670.1 WD40-repeat-containing domain protein [Suillus subaureus]